jgi:hypothetical protein
MCLGDYPGMRMLVSGRKIRGGAAAGIEEN